MNKKRAIQTEVCKLLKTPACIIKFTVNTVHVHVLMYLIKKLLCNLYSNNTELTLVIMI